MEKFNFKGKEVIVFNHMGTTYENILNKKNMDFEDRKISIDLHFPMEVSGYVFHEISYVSQNDGRTVYAYCLDIGFFDDISGQTFALYEKLTDEEAIELESAYYTYCKEKEEQK